ncbi:Glycosyltransferase involved in cell wall bisynthesis [Desulfonauticus submarinus]|uniref:Glycosyltransferase involved in cell wall bisynthesis n=1 Tax=Desulfonauticus submarinus TaxID=206665 RepID=A0A1H0AGH4_9BACT|nr:glycosyltransferase family 4 protein [Desulfonauticus submarinus]SDN32660.1 Glycosyltransferase involved in cell wall bisynthesis [Desulfonauticus submarinus]
MQKKIWASLDPFVEGGNILGRKVANANFLISLLKNNPFDEYHFFLPSKQQIQYVKNFIQKNFEILSSKIKIFSRVQLWSRVQNTNYFCFHLSDCISYFPYLASFRNKVAKNNFPITGTTHSLSYKNFIHAYFSHLWTDWIGNEAIIATSFSGKKVLKNFYAHLSQNYKLEAKYLPPKIVNIPLGIPDIYFSHQDKKNLRKKYNLPLNDPIFIYVGRISHYSKMDILPLLRALSQAQIIIGKPLHLILAGYVDIEQHNLNTIKNLAQNTKINIHLFPNLKEITKIELLQTSDIFLSLSDNIQETFGLSILEAKASKLAIIASHFDGYKELLHHKVDSFLIPIFSPSNDPLLSEIASLLFDNQTHLLVAQQTSFDFSTLVQTIVTLYTNKSLRKKISQKAFEDAHNYKWDNIIQQYFNLWEKLQNVKIPKNKNSHPLNFDFFQIFSHYPTKTIDSSTKIKTSKLGYKIIQKKDFPVIYPLLENFLDLDKIEDILTFFLTPHQIIDYTKTQKSISQIYKTKFSIFWMIKQGFIEIIS